MESKLRDEFPKIVSYNVSQIKKKGGGGSHREEAAPESWVRVFRGFFEGSQLANIYATKKRPCSTLLCNRGHHGLPSCCYCHCYWWCPSGVKHFFKLCKRINFRPCQAPWNQWCQRRKRRKRRKRKNESAFITQLLHSL